MQHLRVVVALGVLAHNAVVTACGIPAARVRFQPGFIHTLPDGLLLADAHHIHAGTSATHAGASTGLADVLPDVIARLARGAA